MFRAAFPRYFLVSFALSPLFKQLFSLLSLFFPSPLSIATGPKEGKVDPDNKPHVGGNQWRGGTGGADTPGLGGKGKKEGANE